MIPNGWLWRCLERQLRRRVPTHRLGPLLWDLAADHERYRLTKGRLAAFVWLLREGASLIRAYRRQHAAGPLDSLRRDIRHARRAVFARPAATLATVGVLALGIGLVSAMFALTDPYVTRPLPYAAPHRLVTLRVVTSMMASDLPTIEGWRARTDLFAGVAAFGNGDNALVGTPNGDLTLRLLPVSPDYLDVLGGPGPRLRDWHQPRGSSETPVVLTAAAAKRLETLGVPGARLPVVDATGTRTGPGYRVRESLPESFLFPSFSQEWDGLIPVPDGTPLMSHDRSASGLPVSVVKLNVLGRLAPGAAPTQVTAALSTAPAREGHYLPVAGYVVDATVVADAVRRNLRPLASGALAAGLLVLLVCAANVSSLMIARGAFRAREFAVREALGASRLDLSRLVLVEIGMVTAMGVVAGLGLALGALKLIAMMIPAPYVAMGAPALTLRTGWFACAAGGVVVLAGLVPSLAVWRVTPEVLFQQASATQRRGIRFARMALTTAQTGVAVVFLVGTLLMARSQLNLLMQDPGYARDAFAVGVRYPNEGLRASRADIDATVAGLTRLEPVTAVAVAVGPFVENIGGGSAAPAIVVDGHKVRGLVKRVSANFFQAAGGGLVEGRLLVPADEGRRAVVSESFARECCDGRSPLGRQVEWLGRSVEVVGVVRDVFDRALDVRPSATMFVPLDEAQEFFWVTYVLRVEGPTPAPTSAIEREIHAVRSDATLTDGGLMRNRLLRSIRDRSFAAALIGLFAVVALGVSAAGIVGVVGSVVARRTREIAIRMTLGAGRRDVRRLVAQEALIASGIGVVIGLAAGAGLSRTLESMLYGVRAADPAAILLAALLIMLIVVAAAWAPARRAVRLAPTDALRID